MLVKSSKFIDYPVMSLQTGREVATTTKTIINPDNLKIIAYEVDGPLLDSSPQLLRLADIRELSDIGMIIDSSDELVSPSDVISLKKIYELDFDLIDYPVVDDEGTKIGKIIDYTIDLTSFYVQQLIVKRPLLKSLNDPELIINRKQIKELNDNAIVIHSEKEKKKISLPKISKINKDFVNPFKPLPEQEQSKDYSNYSKN